MNCAFIGDSIALGLALASPGQCTSAARVGATPAQIVYQVPARHYDRVVLSAGSNRPATKASLLKLRKRVNASRVTWILPQNARAAYRVQYVATRYGDRAISFKAGYDHVHPQNYRTLARSLKKQGAF